MPISFLQQRARVPFPSFTGERIYMREFTIKTGLPPELRRWQPTVEAMLDGVEVSGPVFLMVDQSAVRANATQRRPGLHVDGYWHPATPAQHGVVARHGHAPSPRPFAGEQEALILASDVLGCAAYLGAWDGQPKEGGNCGHIDTSTMLRVDMEPGHAWAGHTASLLHKSVPVAKDCLRTVVRLNVPGWAPRPQ